MTEIFIKYNPYKVETNIQINGKDVKTNSALNIGDKRLQEWIEDLPQILVDECNTKLFKIVFHGTILDYEDLISVVEDAKSKDIKIECEHIPAKEIKDKEKQIDQVFYEIQQGPFEELKEKDIKKAFEMACNSDFEVNVVATMSAGKSTLINALLRKKLMPAKQEACTATITKIKDKDVEEFRANAYNSNSELLESHPEVCITTMNSLNNNPEVSTIEIEGDIPFVNSDDISLVLVDTPGPNNSRDPEHKAATYRMLSESSKTVVLYILNATQLAVNDDNDLLNYVADSMKVGGKQSKDRFIFVVNKLDDFKKGEDSVEGAINKVQKYLEDKGIKNPTIFPASALPALDIRTSLQNVNIDEIDPWSDDIDENIMETITKVHKLIRNQELHLEKYSNLTPSVRGEINTMLTKAKEEEDKYTESLIHTGIVPIESAIKMYVEKYAKTAKIKNIVDTFSKKLESAKSFENTKQDIINNQTKKDEILKQIEDINKKLRDGEEAKKFTQQIDSINYDKEIQSVSRNIIKEGQAKITEMAEADDIKLTRNEADRKCIELNKFSESLQTKIQMELENAVNNHMKKNTEELYEKYKSKIKSLMENINTTDINIKPFELISGDIESSINVEKLLSDLTQEEEVKVDEKWVSNTSKKWYKPWTWLQESGHYKDVYETQEFVDGKKLVDRYLAPVQKQLLDNGDRAVKHAQDGVKVIKYSFKQKAKELDDILNKKLKELELCAKNSEDLDKVIDETTSRLKWLEDIQMDIEAILEI